ncbi:MAG TPA: PQQ-dependent sugar dehydrogenase [Candidatus Limnocylindrales bacterium]
MIRPSRRLARTTMAVVVAATLAAMTINAAELRPGTQVDRLASGGAEVVAAVARQPATSLPATTDAFDPSKVALNLTLFKGGFAAPLLVTNAHDGSNRLFVVEQAGAIRVIQSGVVLSTPLLDLRGAITSGGERGLLSLAFDPKFPTYPYIYVNFTDVNGNTAISRYTIGANPNVAIRSTGVRILTIAQPYANHNGGNIGFGPDGYLYIGMGDGGSAGDPQNRAMNISSLLGKMLRIDVHHGTSHTHYVIPRDNPYVGRLGNDLIWSRGLRNPWRWSFDTATGALWIGDVGQGAWEEIDRSPKSGSTAGRGANYGWAALEGRACFKPSLGCSASGKVMPLAAYPHASAGAGNCSVTGGDVYRGAGSPVLVGGYVFGDYCSGRIWVVSATAASPAVPTLVRSDTASPHLSISSFGRDEAGELYVTDLGGGGVYRISATAKT